jgi:hypothetical protein
MKNKKVGFCGLVTMALGVVFDDCRVGFKMKNTEIECVTIKQKINDFCDFECTYPVGDYILTNNEYDLEKYASWVVEYFLNEKQKSANKGVFDK